jgi:transposase
MRERRYPTDMTDTEWALIEPILPPAASTASRGGRPEKYDRRTVVDGTRYLVDNGITWQALPTDFGIPWRALFSYFARWAAAGVVPDPQTAARACAHPGGPVTCSSAPTEHRVADESPEEATASRTAGSPRT